jgi:hypothetical protein
MTTYYLSGSGGQVGMTEASNTGVAEATSAPTADVVVTLGGGNTAIGQMSRETALQVLRACINYIKSDGWNGNPQIPFGR